MSNSNMQQRKALRLRCRADGTFYVENLFEYECRDADEALQYFKTGVRSKIMASHRLNHASSRSHCCLRISVERRETADLGDLAANDPTNVAITKRSQLMLIDLLKK